MYILLLVLFVLALIVTLAGLRLSSRSQTLNGRDTYVGRSVVQGRGRYQYHMGTMYGRELATGRYRRPTGVMALTHKERIVGAWSRLPHWAQIAVPATLLFSLCLTLFMRTITTNASSVPLGWLDNPAAPVPTTAPAPAQAPNPVDEMLKHISGASKAIVRIGQVDPAQYDSTQEFDTWAYSTCSTTSMTEVMNAYGKSFRVTDVLKAETSVHEITPDLGLLEAQGIDKTVSQFGFKTVWLENASLDKVIDVANHGRPVIVGFPPSRWTGGHLLIVRGGDDQNVMLVDSSKLNMQVMKRDKFLSYWAGFAVVVMPQSEQ